MKFPFSERDYKELNLISEEHLPIETDSKDFFSTAYVEIKRFWELQKSGEEVLYQELKYGENGLLKSRKNWSFNGRLNIQEIGHIKGNRFLMKSQYGNTVWTFNENGILIEAKYGEEKITFKIDEFQNPIQIDNNIVIDWKNGFPTEAREIKKNIILIQIAERTPKQTIAFYPNAINKSVREIPKYFIYDEQGRLIKENGGSWVTEIKYFSHDMMNGKKLTKFINGEEFESYYEEETLIGHKLVEVKSEYQEIQRGKKQKYRTLKKLK